MELTQARLTSAFYERPTQRVARSLLGKTLFTRTADDERMAGIVVEVEAFLSSRDSASHSSRGQTRSNASMYMHAGSLYVYPIHSRHCMNVVTESEGLGAAVLIRAVEPIWGLDSMWRSRFDGESLPDEPRVQDAVKLTQGPGRLCEALEINRAHDGLNLLESDSTFFAEPIEAVERENWKIQASQRIGISSAKELKLRWFIDGNKFVSGCARDHSSGRNWTFGSYATS